MTRINVGVEPWELPDRLLLAEHREITRIPNAVREGRADLSQPIPEKFTLGAGHVRFFYDKLLYLEDRYESLYWECVSRKFQVTDKRSAFEFVYYTPFKRLYNNYEPTPQDRQLIIERIESKGFQLLDQS